MVVIAFVRRILLVKARLSNWIKVTLAGFWGIIGWAPQLAAHQPFFLLEVFVTFFSSWSLVRPFFINFLAFLAVPSLTIVLPCLSLTKCQPKQAEFGPRCLSFLKLQFLLVNWRYSDCWRKQLLTFRLGWVSSTAIHSQFEKSSYFIYRRDCLMMKLKF